VAAAPLLGGVPACARRGPAPPPTWRGFAPYPGARLACSERTRAGALSLEWTGFATADPPAMVAAFYATRHGVRAAVPLTVRGPHATTLAVHAAAATDYPRCPAGTPPPEPTVIIVTRARP
jgi:hypothetical protein